jgi:serine/threonine-protein kinase RsbW
VEQDFECSRPEARFEFELPSDRSLVEETVEKCTEFVRKHRSFHPGRFRVVLRELLINAIEHGNENDASRRVACSVAIGGRGDCVHVSVEDQGEGFDYKSLDMALSDNGKPRTDRGYRLVGNLCRRLGFNEKGNRISVCVGEPGQAPIDCLDKA